MESCSIDRLLILVETLKNKKENVSNCFIKKLTHPSTYVSSLFFLENFVQE